MSEFLSSISGIDGKRDILKIIKESTEKWNKDNISRTSAYFSFYRLHPEIMWSFLASMVSRNAGWNMCDLKGRLYSSVLSPSYSSALFMTYERANYLIFQDVFPQLLLYHYSKEMNEDLFHFLEHLSVSTFIRSEWSRFLENGEKERLMYALIINEQNVIQKTVIENPFFEKKVFRSALYFLHEHFHFSTVLFPTRKGRVYGTTVKDFRNVGSRILLGKRLASILFSKYHNDIYDFACNCPHTGSRRDYTVFNAELSPLWTPELQYVYPAVHHREEERLRWDVHTKVKEEWWEPVELLPQVDITDSFGSKQKKLIQALLLYKKFLK